jgi:hypothetical protein
MCPDTSQGTQARTTGRHHDIFRQGALLLEPGTMLLTAHWMSYSPLQEVA